MKPIASPDPHLPESCAPSLDLERFLPYRLSVLSERISGAIARLYQERFDLTIPEWRVLAIIGRFGPVTATEVGQRTAMDKVRVSRAIARLVEHGRLAQSEDATDRRRKRLAFTRAGAAIYAEVVPLARAVEADVLASLDPATRSALDAVLTALEAAPLPTAQDRADHSP
ncbi:MAG: MarR family transcriptional regulator [Alphaproteobacteria bacterium]|nr:MAG: MarR family transcriptional regulator [Alphaproteobacteria bacterium]